MTAPTPSELQALRSLVIDLQGIVNRHLIDCAGSNAQTKEVVGVLVSTVGDMKRMVGRSVFAIIGALTVVAGTFGWFILQHAEVFSRAAH